LNGSGEEQAGSHFVDLAACGEQRDKRCATAAHDMALTNLSTLA